MIRYYLFQRVSSVLLRRLHFHASSVNSLSTRCAPFGFKLLVNNLRTIVTNEERSLTMENMNPNIKVMEYAVRGPIVTRAEEIVKELEQGIKKPFKEVVETNIGNCHAMGQTPITFIRQVLALITYPKLFDDPLFPTDAKQRAKTILGGCPGGSIGSYSEALGIEVIRRHVAEYIERRDGAPANWENIALTEGASIAIRNVLKLLICEVDGKKPGVMIPIPQYPLYSACLAEFSIHQIKYYLNESQHWGINISELERSISEAKKMSSPRAIVVINPGNPTGHVLSRQNIEEIIKFAHREKLFLLADEVYQHNVYAEGSKFYSFKKVLTEMGPPYCRMELASFMSCSGGYMGECGLRGGYVEGINMDPNVVPMYINYVCCTSSPTVLGQACLDTIVNPPKEGESSYKLFTNEKAEVLSSLKTRAKMVADTLNSFKGFSCNPIQGSMYAFPQIKLPPKAIQTAEEEGKAADELYAYQLLESTGISIVPGSAFDQQPGTFHFRMTILPQIAQLRNMLEKLAEFHYNFLKKYS